MKIRKYEVDILDVEDADAILIHFYDEDNTGYVISIDAGRYDDGDMIMKFVKDHYHTRTIDLAICTHCDDDHYGGYIKILENQKLYHYTGIQINRFWINDPGLYTQASDYKYYQKNSAVKQEVRTVYSLENGKNLLDMIREMKIDHDEAFSFGGDFYQALDGVLEIIGPTKSYYQSLVPKMRNKLDPYDCTKNDSESDVVEDHGRCLSPTLDAAKDDSSSHNRSSIIVLFQPGDGNKFVFMGDASRDSYNNILDQDRKKIENSFMLKVPHHGSKHNINSTMINNINPTLAIVSAKSSDKYFSPLVKGALKKKHALVYSTHKNGSLWYHNGIDGREDEYSTANPL